MTGFRKHMALCLALLLAGPLLFAQESRWEEALARYENICDQCMALRSRAAAGQEVSTAALSSLLSQLSSLRGTLKAAEGQMSPQQRQRFEAVRARYAALSGDRVAVQALGTAPDIPDPFQLAAPVYWLERSAVQKVAPVPGPPLRWGLMALVGVPELSLGGMALVWKKSFGAYLKGSATLRQTRPDGICSSDGTTPGGGYIWTTGSVRTTRFCVTAGALWFPFSFAGVYAGVGYGARNLLWEDTSLRWMQVQERSLRGLAADVGAVFPLGHLTLLAGVSTVSFRTVSTEVGIGYSF